MLNKIIFTKYLEESLIYFMSRMQQVITDMASRQIENVIIVGNTNRVKFKPLCLVGRAEDDV